LPVTAGGTGATTAAGAQTNLSVPSTTGSGASGTWGINITGNAATATSATNSTTTSQTNFSNLTIGGSQVLYAGNYSSYALPLTGGTLSGTSAQMLTIQNTADYARLSLNGAAGSGGDLIFKSNGVSKFGIYNINGGGDLGFYPNDGSTASVVMPNAGGLLIGGNVALSAGNYNSYAPTLTGTGATGTWAINISGNAATSSSTTGNAATATILKAVNVTSSTVSTWNPGALTYQAWGQAFTNSAISGDSGDITMWLRASQYSSGGTELNMYIDGDYYSGTGAYKVLNAGNYNSYAPTLTGTGASGTWGINISGNAATATSSTTATTATNLSGGTVAATTGSFSGALTLNGVMGNSTTPPLVLSPSSSSGTFQWASTAISASLGSGQTMIHILGNALSTGNSGYLGYNYTSSNSASNFTSLGFYGNDNILRVYNGIYTQSLGSMRAPLFYDSDNTGYYVDPASTSNLNILTLQGTFSNPSIWINNGANTGSWNENIRLFDTSQNVSTIAFGATGTSGQPRNSFVSYSSYFAVFAGGTVVQSIYNNYLTASGSYRAPIFYDSDDTAYYVDPNGTSVQAAIALRTGGLKMERSYTSNAIWWNAGEDTNHVLWNSYYGTNPITKGGAGSGFDGILWNTYAGIQIRGGSSGAYNLITAAFEGANGSTNTHVVNIYAYGTSQLATANGYGYAPNQFRAPIFYDSDNTGYYLNPNGTSNVSGMFQVNHSGSSGIQLISTTGTQSLWIRTGWDGAPSPSVVFNNVQFQSSGSSGGSFTFYSGNTLALTVTGDYAQGAGSLRAPIFYDSNDTAYYTDQASTSNYNALTLAGTLRLPNAGLINVNNEPDVWGARFRTSSFSTTYLGSQLQNIIWCGGGSLEGFTVQGSGTGGAAFSVRNDGIAWARSSYRSPIFYDQDDTGYYVDPNGTSNMSAINLNAFSTFTGGLSMGTAGGQKLWVYRSGTVRQGFGTDMTGNSYESTWFGSGGPSSQGRLSLGFVAHSDGTTYSEIARVQASGGILADIYYDINNTAYYLNPNGVSVLGGVNTLPLQVSKTNGANSACTTFQNTSGDNSWGIISEFRVNGSPGTDRPSILFSNGFDSNTWTVGFGYADSDYFRINRDHGFRNQQWGTTLMQMDRSGNVTFTGNVTAYSDERIKTNIKKIDNALGIVRQLNGVTFEYIEDGRHGLGVIAQNVEKVLPMLVSEIPSSNGQMYKNVAYGNMVGVLIEAAKEQDQEVIDLRARVGKLEALISKLTLG
jgi:hypothetical protein